MLEIYKNYIDSTFEWLDFIISWSYALKKQWLIEREVNDIDLCFHKNYYQLVLKLIKDSWKLILTDPGYVWNWIIVVDLWEDKHLDIFFNKEHEYFKIIDIDWEEYLHWFEIAKKKLHLLLNNSQQEEKHINDLKEIFNTKVIEPNIPYTPTFNVEDIPF